MSIERYCIEVEIGDVVRDRAYVIERIRLAARLGLGVIGRHRGLATSRREVAACCVACALPRAFARRLFENIAAREGVVDALWEDRCWMGIQSIGHA